MYILLLAESGKEIALSGRPSVEMEAEQQSSPNHLETIVNWQKTIQ